MRGPRRQDTLVGMKTRFACLSLVSLACSVAVTVGACSSGSGAKDGGGGAGNGGSDASGIAGGGGTSAGSAGAGGVGGASGVAGGGGTTSMNAADVCVAAIEAQCHRVIACQGAAAVGDCSRYDVLCPGYYFNDDSNRTVAGIAGCISALAARTCTDVVIGLYPSCFAEGKRGNGAEWRLFQPVCQPLLGVSAKHLR